MKKLVLLAISVAALSAPSLAQAVPPALNSVGHENRHLSVTLSAPKADFVTVYVATKPDRATDGRFLAENIETSDTLDDSEIQQGRWLHEDQLDPGRYYVMLRASADFSACYVFETGQMDPSCADGFSDVVAVTVPRPATRFSATTQLLGFSQRIYLTLRAAPLGVSQAYRVCYRNAAKARRCVSGRIEGFSWNSAASDDLTISTRGLAPTTRFQWFVGTRVVATKTVRTK